MKPIYIFAVFVFAALLGSAVFYVSSGDPESHAVQSLQVRSDPTDPDAVIFSWTGGVYPPMAREFSAEFRNWKSKASRIVIELDSPGGSVDEGDDVIAIINKMKRTHTVWTYVGPDKDCLSMCVPIYLQGRLRIASATSQWLFHEVSAYDQYTGTEVIMYDHEKSQSRTRFFNFYIDRSDIDPDWRDQLRRRMRNGDIWKTGQELKDERSNIVMALEE